MIYQYLIVTTDFLRLLIVKSLNPLTLEANP